MKAAALRIGGLAPFSAIDYPGKLAAVVFIQGCPWRCGYCHNPQLQPRGAGVHDWDEVMALLRKRTGMLDAVVFSGGEPTIDHALPDAMAQARELGMLVGLHTACIYPRRLEQVLPLVDWVGFDVKAPFADYERVTGVARSGAVARECVELIIASGVAHECRTTLHSALLTESVVEALAAELAGAGVTHYALQCFRAQGCRDPGLLGLDPTVNISQAALDRMAARFSAFTLRLP